ncbi:hypothetical protein [Marivirga harenae]|uniref:hypothetical protein n=1 Tax=Marivirga harenae TaxID=2010992 RepID=UPI0026E0342A|nr:hypothetical protein [Marivirga harenae]WKV12329.1 hypothetical protein Q3Y49_00560 [Marivirga harenae]|tara:strand:+ start:29304 stop:29570 length:267 start_codon:yes stop_codon:yes gene_type:complete
MNDQVWLVGESNPKPDNYIAIFCIAAKNNKSRLGFSEYSTAREALARAKYLQVRYEAKQIRLFYPNSVSIIIKNGIQTHNGNISNSNI